MQITRAYPAKFNITPISDSTLAVKFIVKGLRDIIRIDFNIVIYFRNPIHYNMVEMASSDILSIYTFIEDKYYKAQIKIPEFKDCVQCYMIFTIGPNHGPDKKVFIEDISIEPSSEKIDVQTIEDISLERPKYEDVLERSKYQPIDQIICTIGQSRRILPKDPIKIILPKDLPKDPIKRISYIYPLYCNDSFHIVASNHVKYLKYEYKTRGEYIEIEEIDWSKLENMKWDEKKNILIHPFLYPFISPGSFTQNLKTFAKLLDVKNKIGGFDVADSTKISNIAVDLVNKIDLMIVPSNFAKDAYVKSGVAIPVEVLPHGVPDEFLNDDHINTNNDEIVRLQKLKAKGNILVLYFVIHSHHRKGADLVGNVIKNVQSKFGNVHLVVKGRNVPYFPWMGITYINSWLDNNDLRLLYDTCDVCISPSRGGGFELNTLEAVSRGLPTLVTNGCCFLDLINYFIPIDLSKKTVQPLPGNSIHTGYGCEVDIKDFEEKLIDTINRLGYWKDIFNNRSIEIRKKYSWRNTAKILDKILRQHEFIQ